MTSEMNSQPEPARKRVRVVMVLGAQDGSTVAEGVMEGIMAADAHPMVTMTMSHVLLGGAGDQLVHRTQFRCRIAQPRSRGREQRPQWTWIAS